MPLRYTTFYLVHFKRNDKQLSVKKCYMGMKRLRSGPPTRRIHLPPQEALNRMWRPTKGETLTMELDGGELVTVAFSTDDLNNIRLG